MKNSTKNFFKSIFSGIIGAGVFLMLCIFAFALAKIVFVILGIDLLLSKFNIMAILILFMFAGFVYGVTSFVRKNSYRKLLKMTWMNFLTNIIISALLAFIGYIFLKYNVGIGIGYTSLIAGFVLLFILFYVFSSILSNYLTPKKTRVKTHKTRNAVLFILFNPIFLILYLWLFGIVAYNSIYIPCNVMILGVEKNPYTANTLSLSIKEGERILSIDNSIITSLSDVKRYINGLPSTRQVTVETENNLYYIQTYEMDGKRYMGLLLKQNYCERKYN